MNEEITNNSAEALAFADAEWDAQMGYEFSELGEATSAGLDHRSANSILRRMAEHQREIAHIEEQRQEELERINARADELRQAHERRVEWLEERYGDLLREFAEKELDGKKVRNIKLLSGTIGFRRNPSSLAILDGNAAVEWAKANLPDAVKVVESVPVTPLKSYIEGTGEVLPFAEYTPPTDKFYVKAADDD